MIAFDLPINVQNPVRHQHAVTVLVNRERTKHGLRPLLFTRVGPTPEEPPVIAFDLPINVQNPVRHQHAVTVLVNRERTKHGLRPLLFTRSLRSSARRWALVETRLSRFGHGNFDRRARAFPFLLVGTRGGRILAENLAWGLGPASTPRRIVQAWMRSPAHRATILGNWRYGAVATIADAPMPGLQTSGVTVVQHFGR